MERYMYLVLQSYQVTQVVDNLVDKMDELRENLKVSKFPIENVLDPPQAFVECYMGNYQSCKKNKKWTKGLHQAYF